MKTAHITAVTANIGRHVKPPEAAHNIRAVVDGFRPQWWRQTPAAIGWQEIDEADTPDEHGILHRTVKTFTPKATIAGFATAVPIVVPPGWRIVKERVTPTCPGRPKITPMRVCVQAMIEHEETGIRIVLANGHYPHNAWDLWRICQKSWELIVNKWTELGYTVVTTRDRNKRGNVDPLSPFEVPLLPANLLDKISFIQAPPGPRSVRVQVGRVRTVKLSIDGHDAHGVPLTFTPLESRP